MGEVMGEKGKVTPAGDLRKVGPYERGACKQARCHQKEQLSFILDHYEYERRLRTPVIDR